MAHADLPGEELLERQARWIRPARAMLLRRVAIARRQRVLDLGAGRGVITGELVRRAGGRVAALDRRVEALRSPEAFAGAARVGGDARRLPFAAATFDLVFSQLTLLWVQPLAPALDELARVLAPGGALVALEPDYDGLIEYPPEIAVRALWIAALTRAGADPYVGRKLPRALSRRGFDVHVNLFNRLVPPDPARFDLLRGLPLNDEERTSLTKAEAAVTKGGRWREVAHLPFFLVIAEKQDERQRARA